MKSNKALDFLYALPLLTGLVIIAFALQPIDGKIGYEYAFVIPRLHIGMLFFHQNGFAIPHFTPSLCGGLPFFAHPESTYYSLMQVLTMIFDPLFSCQVTFLIFCLLGYLGLYQVLSKAFHTDKAVAHIGSLLFVFNGFSFEHAFVGDAGYHSFFLIPWILFQLLRRGSGSAGPFIKRAAIVALLTSYMFYSGGAHVVLVLGMILVILTPYLLLRAKNSEEVFHSCFFLFFCFVLVFLCAAGKIVAMGAYLPRAFSPQYLPSGLVNKGGWEFIGFVSKFVFPMAIFWVWHLFRRGTMGRRLVLFYAAYLPICGMICCGLFNNRIPGLSFYGMPVRLFASLIPFMVIVTALSLQVLVEKRKIRNNPWVFYLLCCVLIFEFTSYVGYFTSRGLGVSYHYDPKIDSRLRATYRLPQVTRVTEFQGKDDFSIADGSTSTQCFEPFFGARGEAMNAQLVPGVVWIKRFGRFNLTHPGCLLYPKFFQCEPWDLIKIEDQANLELFTRGYVPRWGVPGWQSFWDTVSLITILVLGLLSLTPDATIQQFSLVIRKKLSIPPQ